MNNIKVSEVVMKVTPQEESMLKELEGMEVFVMKFESDVYSNATMISPINYGDFDKFYKWLYKEVKENWFCCSDTFEEFKNELNQNSDELLPSIIEFMDDFEYIRDVTKKDGKLHEINYNKYFLHKLIDFNTAE